MKAAGQLPTPQQILGSGTATADPLAPFADRLGNLTGLLSDDLRKTFGALYTAIARNIGGTDSPGMRQADQLVEAFALQRTKHAAGAAARGDDDGPSSPVVDLRA